MKRIISLIAVITLMLTSVGISTVNASVANYPYVMDDFDGATVVGSNLSVNGWVTSHTSGHVHSVADGLNGDGLRVSVTNNGARYSYKTLSGFRFKDHRKYTISTWVYRENANASIPVKGRFLTESINAESINGGFTLEKQFEVTVGGKTWEYYSMIFDGHRNWNGVSGTSASTKFNNLPDSADWQFRLWLGSDGNSTNGAEAGTGTNLLYVFDDIRFEPYVESGATGVPSLSGVGLVSQDLVGTNATVNYTYTQGTGATANNALVRVLKEVGTAPSVGYVTVAQGMGTEGTFTYPITEAMVGAKLKYEIFPYDTLSAGTKAGIPVSVSASNAVAYREIITPTLAQVSGAVQCKLTVTNNHRDGSSLNMLYIVGFYDADGGLAGYKVYPCSVADGSNEVVAVNQTITLAEESFRATPVKARAFVWQGTALDGSHKAFTEVMEIPISISTPSE